MTIIHNDQTILNADESSLQIKFLQKFVGVEGNWKAYEFETSDSICFQWFEEGGKLFDEQTSDIFRLEVRNEYTLVLISDGEFMVMEDVSYAFDIDKLLEMVKAQEKEIADAQQDYNEWYEEEGQYE